MYVAMGFAGLAQGPIGVVMPVGIIGTYLLFFDGTIEIPAGAGPIRRLMLYFNPQRILRVIRTLRLVPGLPIAAAIALPWYIAVGIQTHGEWLVGFLGKHNIGRFTQSMEHHNGLPIYYIVAILAGFFPGSAFLPVGIWKLVASVRGNDDERPASAFLLCWICCYVGFFTLAATKLPNYVVPCYPALAVVVGSWFSAAIDRATARDWRLRAGYWTVAVVGIAATITLVILSKMLLGTDAWPALPGVVAVTGGIVCIVVLRRGNVRGSIAVCVATGLVFTTTAMTFTAYRASQLEEGPKIGGQVYDLVKTSHEVPRVATYGYFTPSLVYYLGHTVERLDKPEDIATFFAQGGDAIVAPRAAFEKQREQLPNDVTILAEHERFLRKNQRVVLIGRPTQVAKRNVQAQSR
jgi:4-amino-4-deoxy-L-arabinose transferase-like glycosyltransferase